MRKLIFGIAGASVALASPALARDNSFYVGVEGGMIFPDNFNYRLDGPPELVFPDGIDGERPRVFADGDNGWDTDIIIGYDFGPARLELEGGWKKFDIDRLMSPVAGLPVPEGGVPTGTFDSANGDVEIWSAMFNALADFGGNDGIGLPEPAIPRFNTPYPIVLNHDFLNGLPRMQLHPQRNSQIHLSLNQLIHTAFDVPRTQNHIGVIHKAIKGRRL